jgi:hypothetical protein
VSRVELKTDERRVDLWLEHEPTRRPCPECGAELAGFDHADERTWRHLDTCQFQTHESDSSAGRSSWRSADKR